MSHLREDVEKIDEPQLKAVKDAAEVLGGLKTAQDQSERENERARSG